MIDELIGKANDARTRSNESFRYAREARLRLEEAEKRARQSQEYYRQTLMILKDALDKEPWNNG